MRRNYWVGAATALALFMVPAGASFAGDSNQEASGDIDAFDANQGSGSQTNADDWEDMSNALAGSGNQSAEIDGHANSGSGVQDNSISEADDWELMENANAGSGAQVLNSYNSNGRDRTSDDVVFHMGSDTAVANAALDSQVTGNTVAITGGGSADSSMSFTNGSGFSGMYGINAIALSSGANASQNVSVNVTASVTVGN